MKAARIRTFIAIACLVTASTGALAAPSAPTAPSWGLPELMAQLAQVKSADTRFTEKKFMRILKTPLELSGTLSYRAPARLEKHTVTPKSETLIVDQDKLTIESQANQENTKRRTVTLRDYPVIWAFVESIRGTLAGDLEALRRFYRVNLEGEPRQWQLQLTPTDPQMQKLVESIRIDGAKAQVMRIDILEAGGDRSVMTIGAD